MRNIYLIIIICIFSSFYSYSQTIEYTYDAAGKRISHRIVTQEAQLIVNPPGMRVPGEQGQGTVDITNGGLDDLNWTATPNDAWISISGNATGVNDGELVFVFEENTGAQRQGTITIDAGNVANSPFTFTVTQLAPNNAPTVINPVNDTIINREFVAYDFSIIDVFEDADGDDLTYSAVSSDETVATVALVGSNLFVNEVSIGLTTVTLTADDGRGGVVSDEFTVNIIAEGNNLPIIVSPIADIEKDEGFALHNINTDGLFFDVDGDELSYSLTCSSDTAVTVSFLGSIIQINEVGIGSAVVTITADDGLGGVVTDEFTVSVHEINEAPVVANPLDDLELEDGYVLHEIDISTVFTDANNDELSYTAELDGEGVAIVTIDGTNLQITEVANGIAIIMVTANDGRGGTVSDRFIFEVKEVNVAPVVANPLDDLELTEGFSAHSLNISTVFTDANNDVLSYTVQSDNDTVATFLIDGGNLQITEVGIGTTSVIVTASDNKGGVVSDQFVLQVKQVNVAPVVANPLDDMVLIEGYATHSIDISAVFSDANNDVLSYTLQPDNDTVAVLSVDAGNLLITEVGNGTVSIIVTASDGYGGLISDQFTLTVEPVNIAPVVANPLPDLELLEGFTTHQIDISTVFTDENNDVLSYTVVSDDENTATVLVDANSLEITEVGLGTTIIEITASDNKGEEVTDQFILTVIEGNNPPVVSIPLVDQEAVRNSAFLYQIPAGSFTDPDADDVLTYSATLDNGDALPAWMTFDAQTQTFSGVPPEVGDLIIKVTVEDNSAESISDMFVLNIKVPTAILNIENQEFSVYPNPADDFLKIQFKSELTKDVTVELYDSKGSIKLTRIIERGAKMSSFDISSQASGIYFLKLITDEEVVTSKLIIE